MTFDLPYPPTLNTLYATVRGKRVLSKAGRLYRNEVYGRVLEQHGLFKPMTGPIKAIIRLWVPDKRKRDLDNCLKAVFDSLKAANVFLDDDQIVTIHAYRLEKEEGGRCCVEIIPEQMADDVKQ